MRSYIQPPSGQDTAKATAQNRELMSDIVNNKTGGGTKFDGVPGDTYGNVKALLENQSKLEKIDQASNANVKKGGTRNNKSGGRKWRTQSLNSRKRASRRKSRGVPLVKRFRLVRSAKRFRA